jgi:hypothetical protein
LRIAKCQLKEFGNRQLAIENVFYVSSPKIS